MATKKTTGVATRKVSKHTNNRTVLKRKHPYLGGDDPAQWVWSNRTHRTASEAFRDADYATAIWKCKTDLDRTKEYLGWIVMWIGFFFVMYQCMVGFEKWIAS